MASLLDAMAMNHCQSTATPGSKGQESSHVKTEKVGPKGTTRVPIWCWTLSVHDRTTLRHCLQYEGNHEREAAGPTTASKTKLKRIARYLKGRQRCVLNFPYVGKLDHVIHVISWIQTGLETQREGAPRPEECWQSVRASLFDIGL